MSWKHKYPPPIASGTVISENRPGRQIANCITEIQAVIDNITGADGKGEELMAMPDATGVTDGKVLQAQSNEAAWDWVRATG